LRSKSIELPKPRNSCYGKFVMLHRNQRIFFWTLVFLFLALSPIIVAYSLGYTLNLRRWTLEPTGSIFLKSHLTGVSVFVNGALAKETSFLSSAALLTGLSPETHLVRLERQGHHPWSKAVAVEPWLVTELRNIILVPKPLLSSTSTPEEIAIFNATSTPPHLKLKKNGALLIGEGKEERLIAAHVHSFGARNDGAIFFVDKNGFLARASSQGDVTEIIARPAFSLERGPLQFAFSPTGDLAFTNTSGGLFVARDNKTLLTVAEGVKQARFDRYGEKLLLVKDEMIEALWMKENRSQPFQKEGTREVILRLDSSILDATWWYGDNTHIVIQTKEGIFLTELDGRGGRNTVELFTGKTEAIATSSEFPRAIFFLKNKTWQKMEL